VVIIIIIVDKAQTTEEIENAVSGAIRGAQKSKG
jgi:hypothetical protein